MRWLLAALTFALPRPIPAPPRQAPAHEHSTFVSSAAEVRIEIVCNAGDLIYIVSYRDTFGLAIFKGGCA
jgi:hypothetical protein